MATAAGDPLPAGLTEPDPDTPDERWQAAQVWAHLAEFPGYWQVQIGKVVADYHGSPVPFGRTKRDESRIAAIETGRHRPVGELAGTTIDSTAKLHEFLAALPARAWQAVGLHPTLGEMGVARMVERFVVGHLEEHADQLDDLE